MTAWLHRPIGRPSPSPKPTHKRHGCHLARLTERALQGVQGPPNPGQCMRPVATPRWQDMRRPCGAALPSAPSSPAPSGGHHQQHIARAFCPTRQDQRCRRPQPGSTFRSWRRRLRTERQLDPTGLHQGQDQEYAHDDIEPHLGVLLGIPFLLRLGFRQLFVAAPTYRSVLRVISSAIWAVHISIHPFQVAAYRDLHKMARQLAQLAAWRAQYNTALNAEQLHPAVPSRSMGHSRDDQKSQSTPNHPPLVPDPLAGSPGMRSPATGCAAPCGPR